jgi:hypothetical protein
MFLAQLAFYAALLVVAIISLKDKIDIDHDNFCPYTPFGGERLTYDVMVSMNTINLSPNILTNIIQNIPDMRRCDRCKYY